MTKVCGLLLPGMTLNGTIFPDLGFPAISIDFNEAPPPSAGKQDLMADYVVELERRLLSVEAWREAEIRIVVAHSFGGMLAQRWMLSDDGVANGVDRLVLIATTAGPMYDVIRLKVGEVAGRELRLGITHLIQLWNTPVVTKAVKRVMTGGTLEVRPVNFRGIADPTDLTIDFAGWRNTDWRAMRSYRRAMHAFDTRNQLAQLVTPTIVLHGSDDALFKPEVGRALAHHLPNAEFREIAGARHILPLTHGEAVRDAVTALLGV